MNKTHVFDLLIVYTGSIANSATSSNQKPFGSGKKSNQYNLAYSYFLEQLKSLGINAAFTTTSDHIKNGRYRSYWIFQDSSWKKIKYSCFSVLIFNKFSPIYNMQYSSDVYFNNTLVKPFNNPYLHRLFDDKFQTFRMLSKYTIPTAPILGSSLVDINTAISSLSKLIKNHQNIDDFSDEIILKDRFGAGGIDIYKIDLLLRPLEIQKILKLKKTTEFIIQPFVNFQKGFKSGNSSKATDIRLIFCNGKLKQQYIRIAKTGDFRCNINQGGKIKYINKSVFSQKLLNFASLVNSSLRQTASVYALDFIISDNNNIYFLEGNINPGIYWSADSNQDMIHTKKLINIIANECLRKITINRGLHLDYPTLPNDNLNKQIIV